ncbi:MAG: dephospho-CoA kinase [Bacteroidaceae bacterium]|nr:dephospho-CoA kinase [Bacteroidaceae bacterium]
MIRIGITGGIGSGKTYVCQLLQQRGIPVYHCDDEAKRLMTESSVIRRRLTQILGSDAYISSGLNKPLIAQYLFADEKHAAKVNAIVHPVVRQDFLRWTNQQKNAPIVVQECALLFESGFQDTVDVTVEIYAPLALRLERATQRDHSTAEQILARMAQQMDEEEKRRRADFTILNDGTIGVEEQIDHLLNQINNEYTK